jgi:hypothetical protein
MAAAARTEAREKQDRVRKRLMVRFGPDGPEKTAFTGNLSENGILLKTNHVYPPGTILQLDVEGPEGHFPLVGRVVWVKKVPLRLAQVMTSSMGLYFKDPGPEWNEFCKIWNSRR